MNNLVMCVVSCTFKEVQKLIKTNGNDFVISPRDKRRLKKLLHLLKALDNTGHLS